MWNKCRGILDYRLIRTPRPQTGRKRLRKGSGDGADGGPPAKKSKGTEDPLAEAVRVANTFGTDGFESWIERLGVRWNKSSQDAFLHKVTRTPLVGNLANVGRGRFITVMGWHFKKSVEDPEKEGLLRIQHRRDHAECYCFYEMAVREVQDADNAKPRRPSLFFQWTDRILRDSGETPERRSGRGISAATVVNDRIIDIFHPRANDRSLEERELLRETRKNAMEKRRKRGELWYELIVHLGLGILCLSPPHISEAWYFA